VTLEALDIWQQTFKNDIAPVADDSWPDAFTDWYAERFDTPNLSLPGLTLAAPPLPVVFGKAAFKAIFSTLAPGVSQQEAMETIADAWEAGLLASTVSVVAGDSIGTPSPTTTWSSVSSSVFDAPSIAAGKAKILELIGAPNVGDAAESQTPVKFREATALLTVTTTGLDSTPGGSGGPLPLVDAARAVG